jgi:F-type H+-transporting ATPase subunit epsilon
MSDNKPMMRLFILTPDQIVVDTDVTSVRFQEADGWRGVLPNHTPYITRLVNGTLIYRTPGDPSPHYIALYGGTLEVKKDQVVVLTAAAEPGHSLQELALRLLEREAEADALAFEAHIEFTKVRTALVRALTDLPEPLDLIR